MSLSLKFFSLTLSLFYGNTPHVLVIRAEDPDQWPGMRNLCPLWLVTIVRF
jgi:hypothetical protein